MILASKAEGFSSTAEFLV